MISRTMHKDKKSCLIIQQLYRIKVVYLYNYSFIVMNFTNKHNFLYPYLV